MKATVLLFQFDKERTGKIRRALMPLKIRVRTVVPREYGQKIGYLAGNKEILAKESGATDEAGDSDESGEIRQEMMVMAWFTSRQVDQVLIALRRQGIGRIDYKAVVTPQNQYWDCRTLYEELRKEHEAFQEMELNHEQ